MVHIGEHQDVLYDLDVDYAESHILDILLQDWQMCVQVSLGWLQAFKSKWK